MGTLELESQIPDGKFFMTTFLYWLTQTIADVPENHDWLSEKESSILGRLRFEKRRNDWLLGRWTAKRAICASHHLEKAGLGQLEILAAEDGAPEAFWKGKSANVSISISHSNARSLCAVGPRGGSIGCDLEQIKDRDDLFIKDYFTRNERELCRSAPLEKALIANLIWSAKESVLKAVRASMRLDTRSVLICPEFRESKDCWNKWTGRCLEPSRSFYGWWAVWDGYVYTLVADRSFEPSGL